MLMPDASRSGAHNENKCKQSQTTQCSHRCAYDAACTTHCLLDMQDGKKDGLGQYWWPTGATYKGEWANGSMHGVGTFESPDGTRYQGGWAHDLKQGLGKKWFPNGDTYEVHCNMLLAMYASSWSSLQHLMLYVAWSHSCR